MSYEELVESRKCVGDMSKEELFEYCNGLLEEVWKFEKENEKQKDYIKKIIDICNEKIKIINDVREYIDKFIKANYEDIFNQEQKDYMIKILEILKGENK